MRLREPAAWVALGALVLNLLLALVALATFDGSLPSVAWVLSARLANPVPLVVLTVLVSSLRASGPHAPCAAAHPHQPRRRNHRRAPGPDIRLVGFGATAPVLAVFAAIVQQAISVIAIGFLIKLVQLQAVPPSTARRHRPGAVSLGRPSGTAGNGGARSAPAANLAPRHRSRSSLAYGGDAAAGAPQLDGGLTLQWAGNRFPANRTGQIQTSRSSMGRNLAGRTPWAAIQCVRTLWAPTRSAGTAGSDTKRRQDASANAGTGTDAEPAQRSPG
jgi:hypothetical protein